MTTTTTKTTTFKRGDKVTFIRGMYGEWQGTVSRLFMSRESRWERGEDGLCHPVGPALKAVISFRMANGRRTTARAWVSNLTHFVSEADQLVRECSAFRSFDELLAAAAHGYRPTCRGEKAHRLADLYDAAQAKRGCDVRAYRA
jgi:hypothetical protein